MHSLSNLAVEIFADLCIRRVESESPPPHNPRLLNINNKDAVALHQYWYVTLMSSFSLLHHLETYHFK